MLGKRTLLKQIGAVSFAGGLAGCTGESSNDNNSELEDLEITNNEIGNRNNVTNSTLTIENTGEKELNATISVNVNIAPDGMYGEHSDEQSFSVGGGENTEVTLDLFDGDELSEVAFNEIQDGFFSITYFLDGVERSSQEFGEESSQYVSFKILYDGSWQGALGTVGGQRSISGQGEGHLPVDNNANIVSGNAQKQDSGSGTLTVQILVDGEVIAEQSTSGEYGVAQVSENI